MLEGRIARAGSLMHLCKRDSGVGGVEGRGGRLKWTRSVLRPTTTYPKNYNLFPLIILFSEIFVPPGNTRQEPPLLPCRKITLITDRKSMRSSESHFQFCQHQKSEDVPCVKPPFVSILTDWGRSRVQTGGFTLTSQETSFNMSLVRLWLTCSGHVVP